MSENIRLINTLTRTPIVGESVLWKNGEIEALGEVVRTYDKNVMLKEYNFTGSMIGLVKGYPEDMVFFDIAWSECIGFKKGRNGPSKSGWCNRDHGTIFILEHREYVRKY